MLLRVNGQSLLRWLEMASTILQKIRPRVRGVSEGGGGVGRSCTFKGCLSEIMHVEKGPGDEANIPLSSHRFNFCFQKAMGTD